MKMLKTLAAAPLVLIVTLMLAPSAAAQSQYKVLATFSGGPDGNNPNGGLVFDAAGNLYGTTTGGGTGTCSYDTSPGCGTVFSLTPNGDGSWKKTVIHNFTGYPDDGAYPLGRLIFDAVGNLYGTTAYEGTNSCRCGSVFKLTPNGDGSWSGSLLYSFKGKNDGALPDTSLTIDAAGNLYSTTFIAGTGPCWVRWGAGCGTVFKLTPNTDGTWSESQHRFKGNADGGNPWHAPLSWDTDGNLFGTTAYGGTYNAGTLYKLSPTADGNWKKTVIHHFTGGKDGATPRGRVIFDAVGNLYGTTSTGGTYGNGTVYKLTPGVHTKWTYRVIHQFKGGKDGANSYANDLVLDSAGSVYGTTYQGGAYGVGIAYKLTETPDGSWKETILHTFTGGEDGQNPYGSGLIFDAAGNLYGAAFGSYQRGVVFEITP